MSNPEAEGAEPRLKLTAFEQAGRLDGVLVAASQRRDWMDRTIDRFAYRCLPLVIANQSGWVVRNRIEFAAIWHGRQENASIEFGVPNGESAMQMARILPDLVTSHFGGGVLTFVIPYLFRTPPGYNLWVRGPINEPRDGIQPLDAVVETDWLHATFTMNWIFTRPEALVHFKAGEPICQLFPYPRELLEAVDPEIRPLTDDPELSERHEAWRRSRGEFISDLEKPGSEARERKWQKDYFLGREPTGGRRKEHQTKLDLKEFVRVETPG